MPELESHLIEYLDGDKARTALVLQAGPKKLQTVDANGKRGNINLTQVICGHETTATLDSAERAIQETEECIGARIAEIDTELLWETALDTGSTKFESLAEAYFSSRRSDGVAAIFRAMLETPLLFKRKGVLFKTRTREQVEEQRTAKTRARENTAAREALEKQLKSFSSARKPEDFSADDEAALSLVENYLLEMHDNDAGKALEKLHKENAREAALKIIDAAGRLPEGSDPVLVVAGIRTEFSEEELAAVASITPFAGDAERIDLRELHAFSIDDIDTSEVDDSITIERTQSGFHVGIHIADLATFIKPLEKADLLGHQRTISAYMPTGTVTMLPPSLSCDLASLNKGCNRPAVSLMVDFNRDWEIREYTFARTIVRVSSRLTYEEAETLINSGSEQEPARSVRLLLRMAEKLFQKRLEAGAFTIDKPEYKIRVQNSSITIKKLNNRLASQKIVQESMILYNSLAGSFAMEKQVAVIFRTQSKPKDSAFPVGQTIAFRPGKMGEIFKQLSPAQLSLEPGAHSGLGTEHYIQASSPLRRYADLVMQRQLAAATAGVQPPYERDDLWRILAAAEAAEKDIRAVERKAVKYWCLEYLRQQGTEAAYDAVVTRNNGGNCVVELCDYPAVGVIRAALSKNPGDPLRVRPQEILPARERLVLRTAY